MAATLTSRASRRRRVNVPNWIRHPLWWLPDIPAEQQRSCERIWQHFGELDHLADGRHDTPSWTSHDGDFILCCVRIPLAALTGAYTALREGLANLPGVRAHPPEFLHIAVQEIGFISPRPTRRDEFSEARLAEFLGYIDRPINDFSPFAIDLAGVNSFTDAAFLQVRDNGWLSRIHFRLRDFVIIPPDKLFPYLPIATIAHYTGQVPAAPVRDLLAGYRDTAFGSFQVREIDVVRIATQTPYPPLEVVRSFKLETPRIEAPVRPLPHDPLDHGI